jgi:hypothetical protein
MKALTLLLCIYATPNVNADDDPITKRLNAAQATYDRERDKYHRAINDQLERQVEAGRKSGNKRLLDQANAEREAFNRQGKAPNATPAITIKNFTAARRAMEANLLQAIKDYTRAGDDSAAAKTDKALKSFRLSMDGCSTGELQPGSKWEGIIIFNDTKGGGPRGRSVSYSLDLADNDGETWSGKSTQNLHNVSELTGTISKGTVTFTTNKQMRGKGVISGNHLRMSFENQQGYFGEIVLERK